MTHSLDAWFLRCSEVGASYGYPTFRLTHGFVAAAALSEVRPHDVRDAFPPFPVFVVTLPDDMSLNGNTRMMFIRSDDGVTGVVPRRGSNEYSILWHAKDDLAIVSARMFEPVVALAQLYVATCTFVHEHHPKKTSAHCPPVVGDFAPVRKWTIGHEIKVKSQTLAAARAYLAGDRSGWKLMSRHVVRGHWRNQACGPAHADRKTIWVMPHWKGPRDLTEAALRTYRR